MALGLRPIEQNGWPVYLSGLDELDTLTQRSCTYYLNLGQDGQVSILIPMTNFLTSSPQLARGTGERSQRAKVVECEIQYMKCPLPSCIQTCHHARLTVPPTLN